jgi:hydroxylamine reductase (hybrid-cluster protein)
MAEEKEGKSIDQGTLELIEKAAKDGVNTTFDRAESLKACPIGSVGSCCKHCGMGPCRVPLPKGKEETPEEKQKRRGVCGATAETIAARNFIRMIAGGAAAHSDHGRGVAELFLAVAKGEAPGYEIKDEQKLLQVALDLGVERDSRRYRPDSPGRVRQAGGRADNAEEGTLEAPGIVAQAGGCPEGYRPRNCGNYAPNPYRC